MAKYNQIGEEIPDTTPVTVPLNFKTPLPLAERIKQIARYEMSQLAQLNGDETFEEADDFNIGEEDNDPHAIWEEDFDPEVPFMAAREEEIKRGITKDFDHSKIEKGVETMKKYTPKKEKLSHQRKTEAKASESSSFTQEEPDEQ